MTDSPVRALATYATGPIDLSPATVGAAKSVVLDLLGAAAGGYDLAAVQATRGYVSGTFQRGAATIWFGPDARSPAAAVLANSAAGAALDVDDGHRRASGHPGAAIVPAAMAMAEQWSSSGQELIEAIVVGYEVAIRAGAALKIGPSDTISTGHWCSVGAAAAAGRLAHLTEDETARAIGTAAAFAPRLVPLGSDAHDVKEGIPWAAHAGVVAVELAAGGFRGPLHALADGFDSAELLRGLGGTTPLIESVYFKPYACCRWAHAAIDASLELRLDAKLDASDIEEVTIDTFARATALFNEPNPSSLEAAQYSVPFCVAAALVHGSAALLPLEPSLLNSSSVVALAARVRLRADPELDAMFPTMVPARVTIRVGSTLVTRRIDIPLGDIIEREDVGESPATGHRSHSIA